MRIKPSERKIKIKVEEKGDEEDSESFDIYSGGGNPLTQGIDPFKADLFHDDEASKYAKAVETEVVDVPIFSHTKTWVLEGSCGYESTFGIDPFGRRIMKVKPFVIGGIQSQLLLLLIDLIPMVLAALSTLRDGDTFQLDTCMDLSRFANACFLVKPNETVYLKLFQVLGPEFNDFFRANFRTIVTRWSMIKTIIDEVDGKDSPGAGFCY